MYKEENTRDKVIGLSLDQSAIHLNYFMLLWVFYHGWTSFVVCLLTSTCRHLSAKSAGPGTIRSLPIVLELLRPTLGRFARSFWQRRRLWYPTHLTFRCRLRCCFFWNLSFSGFFGFFGPCIPHTSKPSSEQMVSNRLRPTCRVRGEHEESRMARVTSGKRRTMEPGAWVWIPLACLDTYDTGYHFFGCF